MQKLQILFRIFCLFSYLQISISNRTFRVYWNIPTCVCVDKGVNIPLDKYEIIHNKDETLRGNNVSIFYENRFGKVPYFKDNHPKQAVNGGLPQLANLSEHLRVAAIEIEEAITDLNAHGIGIIDIETWRPLYELNWDSKSVYQNKSNQLVREKFPMMKEEEVIKTAEKEFNDAARVFFTQTMILARRLRPNIKWGFYGFPICDYKSGKKETICSTEHHEYMKKMNWLYSIVDALYPSIYFYPQESMTSLYFKYVQAIIDLSKKAANQTGEKKEIFMYTSMEYVEAKPMKMVTKEENCKSLKQSMDLDVDGIIIWASSDSLSQKCSIYREYINDIFGPYYIQVKNRDKLCRTEHCNGKGHCVLRNPYGQKECMTDLPFDHYYCSYQTNKGNSG